MLPNQRVGQLGRMLIIAINLDLGSQAASRSHRTVVLSADVTVPSAPTRRSSIDRRSSRLSSSQKGRLARDNRAGQ